MNKNNSHKSGFVNIIGHPNVGKSTLLNALLGNKLSIITSKPQTTRHRILGIFNDEEFQIIFSDTPGIIEEPQYKMHHSMNKFAYSSFEDADVLMLVIDLYEKFIGEEKVLAHLKKVKVPVILVINKIDLDKDNQLEKLRKKWSEMSIFSHIVEISALQKIGIESLLSLLKNLIKEGPAYYPKDQLSDKNVRFFVSEIIREQILKLYKKEIPYSCEIIIEEYKESTKNGSPFAHIYADIYVNRKTQKMILIGKGGHAIKQLGIQSRKSIEEFVGHPIYLETRVKVKVNWRDDDRILKHFGYTS